MKKLTILFISLAGAATSAMAQITVWDAGLASAPINSTLANTNFGVLLDSEATANTAAQIAGGTDMWYEVGLSGNNQDQGGTGKGGIYILGPNNGASRGITYVLDSDVFSGPNEYTLNYDVWSVFNPTTLHVNIWDAQASPGNDYFVDLAGPLGSVLITEPSGGSTATVTNLASTTHNRDAAGGTIANGQWNAQTLTFTYDGSGDVVLQFTGTGSSATAVGFLFGGDMTITTVPEPSTMALLAGFAALGLVLYRRRRA